jgi:hypothetical protein
MKYAVALNMQDTYINFQVLVNAADERDAVAQAAFIAHEVSQFTGTIKLVADTSATDVERVTTNGGAAFAPINADTSQPSKSSDVLRYGVQTSERTPDRYRDIRPLDESQAPDGPHTHYVDPVGQEDVTTMNEEPPADVPEVDLINAPVLPIKQPVVPKRSAPIKPIKPRRVV